MLRRATATLAFAALAALGWMIPGEAHAKSPYLEIPPEEEVLVSPAYRYANMTDAEAFAELDRRKIPYTREKATPGVRAPIRLAGKLHDVWVHSSLREEERASTMFEILDARLALALDDFSVILARHDVVEVTHYTMYRPNVPMPGTEPSASKEAPKTEAKKPAKKSARGKGKRRASLDGKGTKGPKGSRKSGSGETRRKDFELHDHEHDYLEVELASGGDDDAAKGKPKAEAKPAPKAAPKGDAGKSGNKRASATKGRRAKKRILATTDEQPHGKWAPPGTRHPAGLAIDVGILKKSDGSVLHVAAHFHGKIGARTCGDGAPEGESSQAKELREIVCEAREAGVFTYALTPNFDAAHADHFHLEIKPGVKWFLYH